MTTQATRTIIARSARRTIAIYTIPMVVMVAAWTVIGYVDQPYRSPTYRRTLLQCVGHAAWVTPIEGAGPAIPLSLVIARTLPEPEVFAWVGPLIGAAIYLVFAGIMSRQGRGWSAGAHILLGFCWLLTGAVVFTRLTMK